MQLGRAQARLNLALFLHKLLQTKLPATEED
jgi:hypothetical protein